MTTRIAYFAYGAAAYLIFLATFLYAIAFVGGFAVPKTLDGAATDPFMTALLIDSGLLAVFAIQHSVMARPWFKRWWTQVVPWAIERSTYVLFASLALALLMWQWRPLGGIVWTIDQPALRAAIWVAFACGWLQVLVMTFLIDHFDLFGLRQVWLHLRSRQYTRVQFATPAPYRVVRHPLYLGFMIAFWAAPTMSITRLVFAIATTAYMLIAIQFEEHDLVHEHGASYQHYRRGVPMIIPGLRRRAGTSGISATPASR
jgi:protein-S-isoprenylcysteine O-methyltransferase Ste14